MSDESKDKHTPGPWFSMGILTDPENVDGLREDDGAILVTQDKGEDYESDIAYAIGRHVSAPKRSDEEIEANARLIAAAPELLAALDNCIRSMRSLMAESGNVRRTDEWVVGAGIAAIAKAREGA